MILLSFLSPRPHNKPDRELLFSSPVEDPLGDIDYIFNMPIVLKKDKQVIEPICLFNQILPIFCTDCSISTKR